MNISIYLVDQIDKLLNDGYFDYMNDDKDKRTTEQIINDVKKGTNAQIFDYMDWDKEIDF